MVRAAKHAVFVISDSDVFVEPDCLCRVAFALNDPEVGAATCLFRGAPVRVDNWVAQLGSLFIDGWFLPSAVIDATLFGSQVCYGPVTAIRREIMDAAGGFPALPLFLADDTELGHITARQGRKVVLAEMAVVSGRARNAPRRPVEPRCAAARTTRALRPASYLASVFTHALPVALLLFALQPTHLSGLILGAIAALRTLLLWAVQRRFGRAATAVNPTPWFLTGREVSVLRGLGGGLLQPLDPVARPSASHSCGRALSRRWVVGGCHLGRERGPEPAPMTRRLIVTADDFGMAREVNEAVEEAHRTGVLTCASLVVTGDAAPTPSNGAADAGPWRGLHFALVSAPPALDPGTSRF